MTFELQRIFYLVILDVYISFWAKTRGSLRRFSWKLEKTLAFETYFSTPAMGRSYAYMVVVVELLEGGLFVKIVL